MSEKNLYRETFSHLHPSPETRRSIMEMKPRHNPIHRLSPLLAAVILIVILSVTAVATFTSPLQGWLGDTWNAKTGQELTSAQTHLIDNSTQTVAESITSNGITVTVDSITVGSDVVWLLANVTGAEFDPEIEYRFLDATLRLAPSAEYGWGGVSGGSSRHEYLGINEQGALVMLFEMDAYFDPFDLQLTDGIHTLRLDMTELGTLSDDHTPTVLFEGDWHVEIPLTEKNVSSIIEVPDGCCPGLYQVQITSTSLRCTAPKFMDDPPAVFLILTDGTAVEGEYSGAAWDEDHITVGYRYYWRWPALVDLNDVVALRTGETEFLLK